MEKITFYTTIENQVREDGTYGLLYDHFESLPQAEAKFYTICAAAAVSEIPYHAAYIISDDGIRLGFKVYDRRVVPTPEPPVPEIDDAE